MASILKVDTITGVATAGSIAITGEGNSTTTNLQQGLAKAWVHAEGDASGAAAADSFNVASMADNGTGDYDMNMSNAMNSIRYMAAVTMGADSDTNSGADLVGSAGIASSSTVRMRCHNTSSHQDGAYAGCSAHGDLA